MRETESPEISDFGSAIVAGFALWAFLYLTASFIDPSPGLDRPMERWGIALTFSLLIGCLLMAIALRVFFRRKKMSVLHSAGIGALLALMPILANIDSFEGADKYSMARRALLFVALVALSVSVFAGTKPPATKTVS
jgi:hypothetical protein